MSSHPKLGILGGTFDPIHNAHLQLALQATNKCSLEQCLILPNRHPPHRDKPQASLPQRLEMIQLAIADHPQLSLSTCEVDRDGPSYMCDTLAQLQIDYPNHQLVLIIGADSFNQLPQWHKWHQILERSQLAVFGRPHYPTKQQNPVSHYIEQHKLPEILMIDSDLDISSTAIRAQCAQSDAILADEIPQKVLQYIQDHHLYRWSH